MRSHRVAVLATAVAALLVSACGGGGGGGAQGAYNDADVAFLSGMVPHHEQAVEMAELVADRSERPELEELASTITETQAAEITTMKDMLAAAGAEPAAGGHGDSHGDDSHGDDSHDGETAKGDMAMEGMAGSAELDELRSLSGDAFDQKFLELMTAHHEGAVKAAEQVKAEGENPEVAALAEDIAAAQRAEIEQMTAWQREWAGA